MPRDRQIHRLVAEAFIGPAPSPKHEVAHNNGDPADNRVSNLRWATHKENHQDRIRHGTNNAGEKHGAAKLTEDAVRDLRKRNSEGPINKAAEARRLGVTEMAVHNALSGRTWAWLK